VQPGTAHGGTRGEALALEVLPGQWLFGLTNENGIPITEVDYPGPNRSPQERAWAYKTGWWRGEGRDITINPATVYETVPEGATSSEVNQARNRNRQLSETAPRETCPGTLVTFRDITDPSTIELVDLADLEATFGPGVRFVSGRYEFTREPRTNGGAV